MSAGLGRIRITPPAFWLMTLGEILSALTGFQELEAARDRSAWERTRWAAAVSMQPHAKKGQRIAPKDLMIFPWEKSDKKQNESVSTFMNYMRAVAKPKEGA
jgi:hypothetical protein